MRGCLPGLALALFLVLLLLALLALGLLGLVALLGLDGGLFCSGNADHESGSDERRTCRIERPRGFDAELPYRWKVRSRCSGNRPEKCRV